VAEAFPGGIRSAAFDGLLSVPLYPYQRQAALFAARAGENGDRLEGARRRELERRAERVPGRESYASLGRAPR
jgi:hypothetical protein